MKILFFRTPRGRTSEGPSACDKLVRRRATPGLCRQISGPGSGGAEVDWGAALSYPGPFRVTVCACSERLHPAPHRRLRSHHTIKKSQLLRHQVSHWPGPPLNVSPLLAPLVKPKPQSSAPAHTGRGSGSKPQPPKAPVRHPCTPCSRHPARPPGKKKRGGLCAGHSQVFHKGGGRVGRACPPCSHTIFQLNFVSAVPAAPWRGSLNGARAHLPTLVSTPHSCPLCLLRPGEALLSADARGVAGRALRVLVDRCATWWEGDDGQ